MRIGFSVKAAVIGAAVTLISGAALASSHREAPFITQHPKVDATDFYLFNSYAPGRDGFVTLIANYQPLQSPYGGPNYFTMDQEALYEIHIDNNGDAVEDLTFQFKFDNNLNGENGLALMVGPDGMQKTVPVPLKNIGGITAANDNTLNVIESYTVKLVRGERRSGTSSNIARSGTTETTFRKPADNIGNKSIPDYEAYAQAFMYEIDIPDCTPPSGQKARVFVGQRKDPFYVNLGRTFDLINYSDPLGARDQGLDDLDDANVTSLVLEVPIACVTAAMDQPIIGGWTTASMRQARVLDPTPSYEQPQVVGGAYTQVSRLGMPLVNEVVIGLPDKNLFNSSKPVNDPQFIDYVHYPTLPELVEIVFSAAGVRAPNAFPREDLQAVFLTGVPMVNQPANVTPGEMIRLNTALPAIPLASQSSLGALTCFVPGTTELSPTPPTDCNTSGFPNGRRPFDDVVDITLRVAMGALLPVADAASGALPFTDGALIDSAVLPAEFPYVSTPIPGSVVP